MSYPNIENRLTDTPRSELEGRLDRQEGGAVEEDRAGVQRGAAGRKVLLAAVLGGHP